MKVLEVDDDLLCINWVVASELRYGVLKKGASKLAEKVDAFLSTFDIQMSTPEIIDTYARVRHQLASAGNIIGSNDLWIASHAFCNQLTLVTHNTKEFSRVENLLIEDWLSG